ncbi:MAG: ComEA family DNA-binding protein [Nannocystales bacterium]
MLKESSMKATFASLCFGLLCCTLPAVAHAVPVHPVALFAAPTLEGTINLNTADRTQLMLLPGVGPATADKVLAYRDRRRFARPAHVMRIKGIGKKTYAKLRRYLTVDGDTTLHTVRPAP